MQPGLDRPGQRPRVLMVGPSLQQRGGVASVLRTWRDQGFFDRLQVHYVATNGPTGRWKKALTALGAWWRCARRIVGRRCDLIHVHTSSYASFWRKSPVFAMALACRVPLVVSLHGGAFREFHGTGGRLRRAWIAHVMRRAACFVVLTEGWARWAREVAPQADVQVVPNVTAIPAAPDARRTEPDLLLYLGRIEGDKGIHVLIEALSLANRRGAGWRLACGGEGDVGAARAFAAQCRVEEGALAFLGWLDDAAKADWLARCALLVLPSFVENMPVVVIEAFAHGRPVLATHVGGLPDMVTPGVDGWLVDAGDAGGLAQALLTAAAGRGTLEAMGRAGRAKAIEHYAPERVALRLEKLYAACVVQGDRPDVRSS